MCRNNLEKHIIDTVKEWQMKIGYMEGDMKLYYPSVSLIGLLHLPENTNGETLKKALQNFCKDVRERLGEINISCDQDEERYCLDIPSQGTEYIAKHVPDLEFLKRLLAVIQTPGSDMEKVRECFRRYAKEQGTGLTERNMEEDGLGMVFFFGEDCEETYVYCMEEDDFGLTYHRFTREEYNKLR